MHIKLLFAALLIGISTAVCSGAAITNDAHKGQRNHRHQHQAVTGNVTTLDGSIIGYTLHNSTGSRAIGTPLVIISGLGQVQSDWHDVVGHFANERLVLTFDNRGLGESSVLNTSSITRENMAEDVFLLLQLFQWKSVNLVGISLGAIIAEEFMKTYASDIHVEHLILVSSYVSFEERRQYILTTTLTYVHSNQGPLGDWVGGWLDAVPLPPSAGDWKEIVRKVFVACLTDEYRKDKKKLERYVARTDMGTRNNRNFATFWGQTQVLATHNYTETVKKITSPTLILHGEQDVAQLVRGGRQLHALIPGSTFIKYPNGGHMLFDTNPEIIAAIEGFMSK
ncbi:hypothetical protein BGZ81_005487 [Podila clonocystis]|nr:hypothetical protein BGZ81_005487 [Podila clonocystis]